MRRLNKSFTLILLIALMASCIVLVQSSSAQSNATPAVTEFSLEYVDYSYTTPPQPVSSKDPYTGQVTTTTIPSQYVENYSVVATIKNPSGATYYNFRWRGHFEDPNASWLYNPYYPNSANNSYRLDSAISVPFAASTSTYSTFTLSFIPRSITPGGQVDVQVQALYGEFDNVGVGMIFPQDHLTYNFKFEGSASEWSGTQTVYYGQPTLSPTPQSTIQPTCLDTAASATPDAPEIPVIAILPLFIVIPLIAAVIIRKYASKTASQYFKKR